MAVGQLIRFHFLRYAGLCFEIVVNQPLKTNKAGEIV
jgi:hypothetical protein